MRPIALGGLLALALALSSCDFSVRIPPNFEPCKDLDQIALAPAITPAPSLVFEEIGSIKVMHGVARATRAASGRGFLRVEQSIELPAYANQATVFLNGWKAAYNNSDHHLADVATLLGRIRVAPGKITWNAFGWLSDYAGKPFTWDYHYTIIAWNDVNVRAMVDHNDGERFCKDGKANGDDNFFTGKNDSNPTEGVVSTTALSSFPSFLKNAGFASGRQVAVLPRGFGFSWSNTDHHLFQLAYNLESVAPFLRDQPYYKAETQIKPLPDGSAEKANGEFVSWKTSVIMKDNSLRHYYYFTEFVSGMSGPDVEIIQPEFTILPREDVNANITGGGPKGGLKSADVVIENLPYTCAVPMLTGWEIGYEPPGEGDQHVKELGIFLENVSYERPSGSSVGTLRYRISSIVVDNDAFPENYFRHKMTILGLKPVGVSMRPEG